MDGTKNLKNAKQYLMEYSQIAQIFVFGAFKVTALLNKRRVKVEKLIKCVLYVSQLQPTCPSHPHNP